MKARRLSGVLVEQDIYPGIVKVLTLFKAYSTEKSANKINQLRDKYALLANAAPKNP